jgi:hypothetical protein
MGTAVAEVFKAVLRPQVALIFAVSLCLVQFLPISLLDDFRTKYGEFLIPAAIFCFVVAVMEWLIEKNRESDALAQLTSLSPGERLLLRQAVQERETVITVPHPLADGESLVAKGLVTPIPHTDAYSKKYLIKPFAWKYLVKKRRNGLSGFENQS